MDRRIVLGVLTLVLASLLLVSLGGEPNVEVSKDSGTSYTIGVLSATSQSDPYYRFVGETAINEINQYCEDSGLDYRFNASYLCSDGQSKRSMENTEKFHQQGINLAVGYEWSSHFCAGLNGYGEANGMVIVSTGSTSPTSCCRKIDNGVRLTPFDGLQSEPLAASIIQRGYNNLIIIARSDNWAGSIVENLEPVYSQMGGNIQSVIEYPGDTFNEAFKVYVTRLSTEHMSTDNRDSSARAGLSGSVIFDEFLDRIQVEYEYWGVFEENGGYVNKICGRYTEKGLIFWGVERARSTLLWTGVHHPTMKSTQL